MPGNFPWQRCKSNACLGLQPRGLACILSRFIQHQADTTFSTFTPGDTPGVKGLRKRTMATACIRGLHPFICLGRMHTDISMKRSFLLLLRLDAVNGTFISSWRYILVCLHSYWGEVVTTTLFRQAGY